MEEAFGITVACFYHTNGPEFDMAMSTRLVRCPTPELRKLKKLS